MDEPTPGLRTPRRYRNRSNGVAKLELRVPAGEEIEVPDGSVVDIDRQPLDELGAVEPTKKAPAKRRARKASTD